MNGDLDDLASARTAPTSQNATTGCGSQAVNLGGDINGKGGDVFVGVGKVDKSRTNYGLAPLMFVIESAKKVAGAHRVAVTAITAAVLTTGTVTAWRTHWPTSVFGVSGAASHSGQAGRVFGDSYSRYQIRVPDQGSTCRYGDLPQTFGPGNRRQYVRSPGDCLPGGHREDSLDKRFPICSGGGGEPLADGNLSWIHYPLTVSSPPGTACPSAISRINPGTGQTVWTSNVAGTRCGNLTASTMYVVCGGTVLSASNGAVMEQLPTAAEGWAFR